VQENSLRVDFLSEGAVLALADLECGHDLSDAIAEQAAVRFDINASVDSPKSLFLKLGGIQVDLGPAMSALPAQQWTRLGML
jgi:hypothetical protein